MQFSFATRQVIKQFSTRQVIKQFSQRTLLHHKKRNTFPMLHLRTMFTPTLLVLFMFIVILHVEAFQGTTLSAKGSQLQFPTTKSTRRTTTISMHISGHSHSHHAHAVTTALSPSLTLTSIKPTIRKFFQQKKPHFFPAFMTLTSAATVLTLIGANKPLRLSSFILSMIVAFPLACVVAIIQQPLQNKARHFGQKLGRINHSLRTHLPIGGMARALFQTNNSADRVTLLG